VKRGESTFAAKQPEGMFSQRNRLTLFYLFELEQNVRDSAMRGIQNIQPGDKAKRDFSLYLFLNP
jgi:hypothetical protein